MSGYRSPDPPVAALLTRHRASALAFLADRFYDYQLLIVQSLGELLTAAPAQPPQLLIVDLLTVREGAERILLAVRATEATALASVVLLSDGPLPGGLAALQARGDFLVAPRLRFLPDPGPRWRSAKSRPKLAV
ncbi:MAG: hypothetical protein E6I85_00595 [Chloroflexi bacterium]|nr:MAG: hypothetical protein E6I85_00595 [Chloroflexota bacterium]